MLATKRYCSQACSSKIFRVGSSLSFVIVVYIILFVTNAKDYIFAQIGGYIGCISSFVVISSFHYRKSSVSAFKTLYWRAWCDFFVACRFVLVPAFNVYLCGDPKCTRLTADEGKCLVPSLMFQFFALASEAWFFCSGLDLFYSVTDPFTSSSSRLKMFHVYAWTSAIFVTLLPFIINQYHEVYGFWFISNASDDYAICWIKIQSSNELGWPIFVFFFTPLMAVYLFCLGAIVVVFYRLRRGLTRSFLSRMKLLVTNTSNLFVLTLFWAIAMFIYAAAFFTRFEMLSYRPLFDILNFLIASKGYSSFVVFIMLTDYATLTSDDDKDGTKEESVDANKALREEVLNFATAGIRSTARSGSFATPEIPYFVRSPRNIHKSSNGDQISFYFFLRFMMGETEQFSQVEIMMARKRRSINANFRETIVRDDGEAIDLGASASESESRLSQRPTVATVAVSSSFNPLVQKSVSSGFSHSDVMADKRQSEPNDLRVSDTSDIYGEKISIASARASDMVNNEDAIVSSFSENNSLASLCTRWFRQVQFFFDFDRSDMVEFVEYEPYQFRRVRLAYGVSDEIYITAFKTTIKERLTEGGASGAFFFFSQGEKFIAKSCSKEDMLTLSSCAKPYADFMVANLDSFICKIFGAYRLKIYGTSLYFFVMNNLFFNHENLTMNEKYDLKGSWVSRNAAPPVEGKALNCSYCEQKFIYRKKRSNARSNTSKSDSRIDGKSSSTIKMLNLGASNMDTVEEGGDSEITPFSSQCRYTVNGEHIPSLILKDNDIKYKLKLPPEVSSLVLNQLRKDAEFLASNGIMDYSLLVGVHNTEYEVFSDQNNETPSLARTSQKLSFAKDSTKATSPPSLLRSASFRRFRQNTLSMAHPEEDIDPLRASDAALATKLEVFRVVGPDAYFIGIIDFNQKWTFKKKMERFIKVRIKGADPRGLSAIEPQEYKERFLRKMEDILDTDSAKPSQTAQSLIGSLRDE